MEVEDRNTLDMSGRVWHKKGDMYYYHREDGPAFMYDTSGLEHWYYYNKSYILPGDMPLNLFLAYYKWEYKKNGN